MKAKPVIFVPDKGFVGCPADMATHLTLRLPGPAGLLTLPVMIKGTREGTGKWTWNGDTNSPTLRPSVLVKAGHFAADQKAKNRCWCDYNREHPDEGNQSSCFQCHSWISDGKIQFLPDSSHALSGKTIDLLPVD